MQDSPSSPALHHLKLAQAYLDEAHLTNSKDDEASVFVSELMVKSLSKAAEHLNKARALDPNEVLWVEDKPGDGKYQLTQDFLNSRALTGEGIAARNSALDILTQFHNYMLRNDGKPDREKARIGTRYLETARDAFEKSLKYAPFNTDALKFLSKTYRELGDKDNYKRVLQRRTQIDPDDIDAHKELDQIDDPDFIRRAFEVSSPFRLGFNSYLLITIALGFLILPVSVQLGGLMVITPPVLWWVRRHT